MFMLLVSNGRELMCVMVLAADVYRNVPGVEVYGDVPGVEEC